jgi:hypothetical protein
MAKLQSGTRVYGNTSIDTFITVGANASITGTTNATSNSTGTLTVAGGVGIKGNVFTGSIYITGASNNLTFVDGTTLSTSPTASISAAFTQANTSNTVAIAAYVQANAANLTAVTAFDKANTVNAFAQAAFDKANTGGSGSSSGYLANSIIFANTTGYLSNVNGLQFFSSNNTIRTTSLTLTTGAGGQITFADGTTQATAASGAATDQTARNLANTANNNAQASFDKANLSLIVAQASYDQANASNITAVAAFNQANSANLTAVTAFNQANVSIIIGQAAYLQANAANLTAVTSFNQANSANLTAVTAFNQANVSIIIGQAAYLQANAANITAVAAFNQANSANLTAVTSFNQANVSIIIGQASYLQANAANITAVAAFNQANSANLTAVTSFNQANTATIIAQAAYNQANVGGASIDQTARTTANNAYSQANVATIIAQAAYAQANTGGGGGSGTLSIAVDNFTASGSSAIFALSNTPASSNNVIVNLNGVTQLKSSYTVVGSTLTLSETPVVGTLIDVTTFLSGGSGSSGVDQTARTTANSAAITAQAAFDKANTGGSGIDQTARTQANTSNTVAIAAYNQANTATIIAQAAYAQANTGGGSTILPLILNDISNQFTGSQSVFTLFTDQTNITSSDVVDSKNMEVIINGLRLAPYIKQNTYPWLTPYDSFIGFRVVSDANTANLIIYNSPAPTDQAVLTIINRSTNVQTRKYPYSATTIALGD